MRRGRRLPVARAQLDHLALHRAHRRPRLAPAARPSPRPGAAGEDDGVGAELLIARSIRGALHVAIDRSPQFARRRGARRRRCRRRPRCRCGARRPPRAAPRAAPAVSARGSTAASPAARTPPWNEGASPGSSSRHRRGVSHSASRLERALQVVDAAQLRRLVAVEGDVQRAAALVAGALPRRRLQLGDELRIERAPPPASAPAARARRRSARRPAPASRRRPGSRRAGGSPRSSTADPRPALRRAPGAGEADHATADDHHIETALLAQILCLRRHYPDQVQTVGGLDATLSARRGLPYRSDATPPPASPTPASHNRADEPLPARGRRAAAPRAAAHRPPLLRLRCAAARRRPGSAAARGAERRRRHRPAAREGAGTGRDRTRRRHLPPRRRHLQRPLHRQRRPRAGAHLRRRRGPRRPGRRRRRGGAGGCWDRTRSSASRPTPRSRSPPAPGAPSTTSASARSGRRRPKRGGRGSGSS